MHLSPWFLYSLIVVLAACLTVCAFYLWKFARLILALEDALEVSLDILDERYKSMYKILETPIFFDSLEVRQCVSEIKKSRDAILYIANVITDPVGKLQYEERLNKQLESKEIVYGKEED